MGQFFASIAVLISAAYACLGTELIAITFGETENPRRNIPCAIRLTFYRITVFGFLAFLNVSTGSAEVFQYFVNVVTIFEILTWMSLLITHICFVRTRKVHLISNSMMVYTAPFGLWGTYFALVVCTIIALFKNFHVFVKGSVTGSDYGDFDYKSFITGYPGIPVYAILFVGFKDFNKTEFRRPETTDLYARKQEIDDEEAEFLERRTCFMGLVGQRGGIGLFLGCFERDWMV
ncbi:hypothetical protein BDZ45DRAFT_670482 [Acephala macrosclerotiorum]|nr:hypothetical protein BDZ45DRAFT_670482 [Acephala macrosclerotiorum]